MGPNKSNRFSRKGRVKERRRVKRASKRGEGMKKRGERLQRFMDKSLVTATERGSRANVSCVTQENLLVRPLRQKRKVMIIAFVAVKTRKLFLDFFNNVKFVLSISDFLTSAVLLNVRIVATFLFLDFSIVQFYRSRDAVKF